MKKSEILNARPGRTWTAGINKFSDLTEDEWRITVNLNRRQVSTDRNVTLPIFKDPVPTEMDWRKKNVVTRVKDQGSCGSCWCFSATGSLESAHAIKTGKLVELSEQQIVDCASSAGSGCGGGDEDAALRYVKENGGQDTEDSYPYEGSDNSCRFKKESVGATVTDVVTLPQADAESMRKALGTIGPLSVCFDVEGDFQQYQSGVYDSDSCSTSANHAVLAVGYGTTTDGKPYWIVKNSWGASWGMNGYFFMARGKDMCGIEEDAAYPVV